MRTLALAACAAGLSLAVPFGPAFAQSNNDVLARLEAKIDALSKENASLRERVHRIESTRRASPAPQAAATPVSRPSAPEGAMPNPSEAARAAHAASYPVKARPLGDCAAPRFQGAYAGIHAGAVNYTANRSDLDGYLVAPILPNAPTYVSKDWGGLVGGQIGYNWTRCGALWGVELDGSWTSAETSLNVGASALPPGAIAEVQSRMHGLATARVRAGIAVDNLLLYVTGGVAAARTETNWTTNFITFISPDIETQSHSAWRWGWVAGFGTEWAWTDRVSLRSEALYVDLADQDYTMFSNALGADVHFKNSDSMWIGRVSLNYKLWN